AALAACRVQQGAQVVEKALRDLAHEMLLGREVIEEGLLRDVGGLADLVDLHGFHAVRREPLPRGADDAVVHLSDTALASRLGGRSRRAHAAPSFHLPRPFQTFFTISARTSDFSRSASSPPGDPATLCACLRNSSPWPASSSACIVNHRTS